MNVKEQLIAYCSDRSQRNDTQDHKGHRDKNTSLDKAFVNVKTAKRNQIAGFQKPKKTHPLLIYNAWFSQ